MKNILITTDEIAGIGNWVYRHSMILTDSALDFLYSILIILIIIIGFMLYKKENNTKEIKTGKRIAGTFIGIILSILLLSGKNYYINKTETDVDNQINNYVIDQLEQQDDIKNIRIVDNYLIMTDNESKVTNYKIAKVKSDKVVRVVVKNIDDTSNTTALQSLINKIKNKERG